MSKVIVSKTWEDLAALNDGGLALYGTPGAAQPYWSNRPNFMYDEQLATVYDFQTAEGMEFERDPEAFEPQQVFSVEVELIPAR